MLRETDNKQMNRIKQNRMYLVSQIIKAIMKNKVG